MSGDLKIIVVTACSAKKEKFPQPAWQLYKSSRIKYLYRKSKELGYSFYILSGKYGLVDSEEVIEPYDEILSEDKIEKLFPQVAEVLKDFDIVIYYKGGARGTYLDLIKTASEFANIKLVTFGYANMGDINKLEEIINSLKHQGKELQTYK